MAQEQATLDVTDMPELRRLAEEAHDSHESITLRLNDVDIAKITPIGSRQRSSKRTKTEADYEEFLSTFGAWEGIDSEQLKEDVISARGSTRPDVEL